MSFLDDIRAGISDGFDGLLRSGTTLVPTLDSANDFNDPISTFAEGKCQGCTINISAYWRSTYEVPEDDVGILLILGLTDVTIDRASKDFYIFMEEIWYKVRRVMTIDPAHASAQLQCYIVDKDPRDEE